MSTFTLWQAPHSCDEPTVVDHQSSVPLFMPCFGTGTGSGSVNSGPYWMPKLLAACFATGNGPNPESSAGGASCVWHEMQPMPSEFTASLPPLTATPPSAAEPSAFNGSKALMSCANGAPTGAWQLMQDFAATSKRACCSSPRSAASCSFSPRVTGSCASMIVPICASAIDDSFQSCTTSLWQSAQLSDATNAVLSLPNAACVPPSTSQTCHASTAKNRIVMIGCSARHDWNCSTFEL